MANPYIGEIRLLANNFAPRFWSQCLGQIMAINQNTTLFSLLGTAFGGNGQTNFALPNLIGRVPLGFGTGPGLPPYVWGEQYGQAEHYLTISEMPAHNHTAYTRITLDQPSVTDIATDNFLSRPGTPTQDYNFLSTPPGSGQTPMGEEVVGVTGAYEGHENRQPFICINYYISFDGTFPPRS